MAAEEELPGFLFVCNKETEPKCLRSGLFGLPIAKLGEMYKICPSTALFLFNFNTVTLHGIYTPVGPPGQDIVPNALTASGGMRFPAQIRFARTKVETKASARGTNLPQAGPLTKDQVRDLKKLLGVKTPLTTSLPAATIRRPLPFVTMPPVAPAAVAAAAAAVPSPSPPSEAAPPLSEHYSEEELAKRRIADDGNAYTWHEFRSFYGASDNATKWDQAIRATRCMHLDRPAGCFFRGCVYNHGPPLKRRLQHFATSETIPTTSGGASRVAGRVASVPSSSGGSGSGGGGSLGSSSTTSSALTRGNVGPSVSRDSSAVPQQMAAVESVPDSGAAAEAAVKAPAYVFVVSPAAAREFLAYNVAGDVQARLGLMQASIGPSTELYLHCATNRRVYGVFLPEGPPAMNFDSTFCEGNLPAQIVFKRTPMDLDVSSDELFFDLTPGLLSNAHALQLQQLFVTSSQRHTTSLPPNRQVNMRWECSVCTFHNPQPHLTCGICSSAQPDAPIWHQPPESEAVVTELPTIEAPAAPSAALPATFAPSTSGSSGTEEVALRSLLDSFGVSDDAITSLISMGCMTLDHLAKASDAVLSAHGIKKGPRLKVLRWAGAQQTTSMTGSSTNANSGGSVDSVAQATVSQEPASADAARAGSMVRTMQPSGLNAAGSTNDVALDAHLRLLLMQIGASTAEGSLSRGGVSTVDALAMCSDADLVNMGMQHDARTKIMTWRQANYPAFVAAEGGGSITAASLDHDSNMRHQGGGRRRGEGGGGERQIQSAAPSAALAELLNEVGIPENTWDALAGVGIITPADLLSASDEVLEASGLKRGPRIKLAHFKKKTTEAVPTASASATSTKSNVQGTSYQGAAATPETNSAPIKSAAEKAAAEKVAADEAAAVKAAEEKAVAEKKAARKERKALAAAEKAAAEREAERKKMAAAAEKEAAKKAAAEKAAAKMKAAEEKAATATAEEKAAAEKKAAAKKKAAEDQVAAVAAEKKASTAKAAADKKIAEKAAAERKAAEEIVATEKKAAADMAAAEKTAVAKVAIEEDNALPKTLPELLLSLELDDDSALVEALQSAGIFEIRDLNAIDPAALLDKHFKNDPRLNSKKRNKIGRWMNRHLSDYPFRMDTSSKASSGNGEESTDVIADHRKVTSANEPATCAGAAAKPIDSEALPMATAATTLLAELGLDEMSNLLASAGIVSLEQIASSDAEDVLEQQGVKKGPRMKLRKGAQAQVSGNPPAVKEANDSAAEAPLSTGALSMSTAAMSLLEELGLGEMSVALESAGIVRLEQNASGDAEDVLEQQGVKKGPRMKLRRGAQAQVSGYPPAVKEANDSAAEAPLSTGALSMSTAAMSLLEELGLGEMSSALESAGIVCLEQIASGDAEDVLEQQGVKKGPRMKLRKGAQALAPTTDDNLNNSKSENVETPVGPTNETTPSLVVSQEVQRSVNQSTALSGPKQAMSDVGTTILKQLELEEMSHELASAGVVDVYHFALGEADDVLEKHGIRRVLRMKLRKEAQCLMGISCDDATALGVEEAPLPMTSSATSLLEKLGLERMTDVLASAGVVTLEQFVAGEAEDFLFAYSVESETRSKLVEEAQACISSVSLRLGVRSLVLLPPSSSPPSPKRGSASQKASSDEFAEVMQIMRDTSVPSGVLVKVRKFDSAGKVVRQRGEYAKVDFGQLRAVPLLARVNFRGAAAKLSSELEAEEIRRGERVQRSGDVETSERSAPPVVRSLKEWLEYFKVLAEQGVWLRSIVRPQSGWLHPETWGGPSAVADKKHPSHVWGVVDASITQIPKLEELDDEELEDYDDPPAPQPHVVWYRVNPETASLEESPPRDIERSWALTDVEVVTWPDLHAYLSSSPRLAKALIQLGGCLTAPREAQSLDMWGIGDLQIETRAYRYLAVLQALKLAYDLAQLDVCARNLGSGAHAEAEGGVCCATVALIRRILVSGDSDSALEQELGHEQILPVNGTDFKELASNAAATHALDGTLKGFLLYANTEEGLGQNACLRPSIGSLGSKSMDFVKSKMIGIDINQDLDNLSKGPFMLYALDADEYDLSQVLGYIPSAEVAASLVVDFANSRNAKFAIALARRAGVADIQALLPTPTIRTHLLEAIYVSEPGKEYHVVSDPDVVSALATRTTSGILCANYGRKEVLHALRLVGALDLTRDGYRAKDCSGKDYMGSDDRGRSSAEDSLTVLRILMRHSTRVSLLDDDEPYFVLPSDFIQTMAAAIVPFLPHPGIKVGFTCEPIYDVPFWEVHHDRVHLNFHEHVNSVLASSSRTHLRSLSVAAVCSLAYHASVPANALAPDGGWHCHLCAQGRQRAAPLCVCPDDGFSVCVRCAAAWFAARSGPTTWVDRFGEPEGPSELQVRFEAVAEAARLAAPMAGFADLNPSQLDGWHSGPWANGGSGASTSPYIVYAILAAIVGSTAPCAASPADLAATAAALASSRSLEIEQCSTVIKTLHTQIAKHESKLRGILDELQEAKTALSKARDEEARGLTCTSCTFLNEPGSSGGGVICTMCDHPLPPLSSASLAISASTKETEFAEKLKVVNNVKADLKTKEDQLETLKKQVASGESAEHGESLGLEPFLVPGGAVDRYIWSLPFLLRRINRDADEIVSELEPGWEVLSVVSSFGVVVSADHQPEIMNRLESEVSTTTEEPAVFAAHPVFSAIEELRAVANAPTSGLSVPSSAQAHLPDNQPLQKSYFSRAESLAGAVESCCWQGVEACLSAGAPATLVSLPVAMKLLHACARDGSGPAAAYGVDGYKTVNVAPFKGVEAVGKLENPSDDPLALGEGRDLELLRALLVAGASAKEDAEGEVPLVTALWLERLDYLALIAEFKPDPNLRDLVGDSPLHVAIYTNQLEAAAKLREMDHVDCNATNLKGDSPMSLVLQAEHVKFNAIVRRYNEQFKKYKKRQKAKAKEAAAAAESSQNAEYDDQVRKPGIESDDKATSTAGAISSSKGPTKAELMAQQLERIDTLTEAFLLSPEATETDAVLQQALDSGQKALDDGEDDDTPVVVVPWDKADSSEAAAAFWSQDEDLSITVLPAPLLAAASSGSATAKEFDTFESLVWEVELSDKVVRWFRRRAKRSSELCELVVQRLRILASGRWSYPTNQKLLKGVPKNIHLYEAKIDAAKRILWEVAVTFSERRSANLAQEGQHAVFAEGIRVWAIVEDHDDISSEVDKVVLAHRRGSTCFLKTSLASNTDPLKGAAAPDELDALAAAASAEEEDGCKVDISTQKAVGRGSDTGATKQSEAAAALSALVMKRGEAGPRTFLGVDGDFQTSSSSSLMTSPSSLSAAAGTTSNLAANSDPLSLEKSPVHYPPASPDPNDYKLLKFYSVTGPTLRSLLNRSGKSDASLPFKVTSKEWAILQLDTPRAILLLGRSGTGKTSCICYRLAYKWSQYWESTRSCFETPPDVLEWRLAYKQHLVEQQQAQSSLTLGLKVGEGNEEGSGVQRAEGDDAPPCHLRQLFLTKNPVLRGQVEDVTRSLCQAFSAKSDNPMESNHHGEGANPGEANGGAGGSAQPKGANGIGQLQAVPDERFPLFLTGMELLRALDASLPGERFQESKLGGKITHQDTSQSSSTSGMPFDPTLGIDEQERAALADLSDYFLGANDADDLNEGNDDDVTAEGATSNQGGTTSLGAASSAEAISATATSRNNSGLSLAREVTYQVFAKQLWPKMKTRDTTTPAVGNSSNSNSSLSFEPALVWTEIKSYVKGSVEFLKAHEQADLLNEGVSQRQARFKEAYLGLGRKRVSMDAAVRERVWELFLVYQKLKRELGFWDEGDLVLNLHRRFRQHSFSGILFHHVFVDEVQDFTQAELYLVLSLCRDPDQCFLAGDTAQTIARGVGFRFTDIKDIFHGMSRAVPDTFTLVHNYRSHRGVLTLAAAVVDVIYSYFPSAIDKLEPDQGLFPGPKPKLLLVDSISNLTMLLLGHQRRDATMGSIEFGAQQVVLVRSDAVRSQMPKEFTDSVIVLTVFEAKGLEFDDVLLWNFFSDGPTDDEWRAVYSYWLAKKERREDAKASSSNESLSSSGGPLAKVSLEDSIGESAGDASEFTKGHGIVNEDAANVQATSAAADATDADDAAVAAATGKIPVRPLEFDVEKHKVLESELKALYCAITRARVNVWIVDFDLKKRKPAFAWFAESSLCEVVQESDDGLLDTSSSASDNDVTGGIASTSSTSRSTPEEWLSRGAHFFTEAERQESKRGLYEAAATCFRRAERPDLLARAVARLAKHNAKEAALQLRNASSGSSGGGSSGGGGAHRAERLKRSEVDQLFLAAAEKCLEAKLGREAAFCLVQGKDDERAAALYSAEAARTGSKDSLLRAAKCYSRLKRYDDSIELLWRGGYTAQAVRQAASERRFGVAARLLDLDQNANSSSSAVDVKAQMAVQQLSRLAAKDALAKGNRAQLLSFLRVLPVLEQVAFLQSAEDTSLAASVAETSVDGNRINSSSDTSASDTLSGGNATVSNSEGVEYLGEIIAVLTRAGMHAEAAAQCAAHGEHLRGGEVLRRANAQLPHRAVPDASAAGVAAAAAAAAAAESDNVVPSSSSSDISSSGPAAAAATATGAATAMMADRGPLLEAESYLRFIDEALGCAFPAFPEANNTADTSEKASSSEMERGVLQFTEGAWVKTRMGQSGTLVCPADSSVGTSVGSWLVRLFDGTEVEVRSRDLTGLAARAGLKGLLQQVTQLLDQQQKDTSSTLTKLAAAAVSEETHSVPPDEALSLKVVSESGASNIDEAYNDDAVDSGEVRDGTSMSNAETTTAAAKASAEKVLALVAWRRAQVMQYEAQLMPSGPAAIAQLGKALEALAQLPDRVVAVASTAGWMAALATAAPSQNAHGSGGEDNSGESPGVEDIKKQIGRTACTTWNDPILAKAREAIRTHACPAAVVLARALVGKPLPQNSLASSLSLVHTSNEFSDSTTRTESTKEVVMGMAPEATCSQLESLLGLEPALVGDPSNTREFRQGHKLLSTWAPMVMTVLAAKDANASSSSPTDPWTPAPGRGRTHLAMPRDAARLALSLWLACSATAFLRADLPEKWPDHRTVAMVVADASYDSNSKVIEHENSTEATSAEPPLSALTLEDALAQATISGLEDEVLLALRNEGIVNGEQLAVASESVLTTCGVKKGPRMKLKKWRKECADSTDAASIITGGAVTTAADAALSSEGSPAAELSTVDQKGYDVESSDWEETLANTLPGRLACEALLEAMLFPTRGERSADRPPLSFLGVVPLQPLQPLLARSSNNAAGAGAAAAVGAVVAQDTVVAAAAVCAGASSAACAEQLLLAATHLGHRIDAPSKVADALSQLFTRHLASDGIARVTWGNASGIVSTLCGALDRAWKDSRQHNGLLAPIADKSNDQGNRNASAHLGLLAKIASGSFSSNELSLSKASIVAPVHDLNLCLLAWHVSGLRQMSHPSGGSLWHDFDARLADLDGALLQQPNAEEAVSPDTEWHLWRTSNALLRGNGNASEEQPFLEGAKLLGRLIDRLTSATAASVQARAKSSGKKSSSASAPENATPASRAFVLQRQASVLLTLGLFVDPGLDSGEDPSSPSSGDAHWWMNLPSLLPWSWVQAHLEDAPLQAVHDCLRQHPDHDTWPLSLRADRARTVLGSLEQLLASLRPLDDDADEQDEAEELQYQLAASLRSELLALAWALWWEVQDTGAALVAAVRSCTSSNSSGSSLEQECAMKLLDFERIVVLVLTMTVNAHHLSYLMGPQPGGPQVAHEKCGMAQLEFVLPGTVLGILVKAYRAAVEFWREALSNASQADEAAGSTPTTTTTTPASVRAKLESSPVGVGFGQFPEIRDVVDAVVRFTGTLDAQGAGVCELLPVCSTHPSMNSLDMAWELQLSNAFQAKDFLGKHPVADAMVESSESDSVWRIQLDCTSAFDLKNAGDSAFAVTVEAVVATVAQVETGGSQDARMGMRCATALLSNGRFIEGSAAAAVERERLALVEQRLEGAKYLNRILTAWYRARAKSKAKASQDQIASGSGSVAGNDDNNAPATEDERAGELLAALPAWPSSTHGCALCGVYWPKDVKAFLSNAKQRFIAMAKQAFGPGPWADAVANVQAADHAAKYGGEGSLSASATTAASSSGSNLSPHLALKAANALQMACEKSDASRSSGGAVSVLTPKPWHELRGYSISPQFKLCLDLDAAESALNEFHASAIGGGEGGGQSRSSRARRANYGANGLGASMAVPAADLAGQVKLLYTLAKKMFKQSAAQARKSHMSSPAHKHNFARWHAYSLAERGLCAAAARAQLFLHRLPPADVARAMPTLGAAVDRQLAVATIGRNFDALRRNSGKNGDKMIAGLKDGTSQLSEMHAQTAADLDDSVYLWNGENREGTNSGVNGTAAAAEEDESDEEGDDDDVDVDGDDFTLAPAAKRGGSGKSRSGTNGQANDGDGDGEWTTVGKKKKRKKGQQKGRSRGGLVKKRGR